MNEHPFVLILAGGAGTRFWPASREHLPKQFLDITGSGMSLIRETADRFLQFVPKEHIYVMTHTRYAGLVRDHLPELSTDQIILEPSRNNTAAAIALASFKLSTIHPNAVCIVAPADHVIQQQQVFEKTMLTAIDHAIAHNSIITLGIEPTRADTGYGYIEFDKKESTAVRKVTSFREKPDLATAGHYLQRGSFVWNAGIFIWKIPVILEAFKMHAPRIYDELHAGLNVYNTPHEHSFILRTYPNTERISVDYAILEQASNVYTIPCDIGWSDLGTWNSLYDHVEKDGDHNALLSRPVHATQTARNLILSKEGKLVVVKGLSDFIVVDTDDCLLVFPRSDEQAIKELKETLREKGLDLYL